MDPELDLKIVVLAALVVLVADQEDLGDLEATWVAVAVRAVMEVRTPAARSC